MSKMFRTGMMLCVLMILALGVSTVAFASTGDPMKITAYEHDVDYNYSGSVWWQSGTIEVTNRSTEQLRNWVVEFDASSPILEFENVKCSVKHLANGDYRYTVSPVSWKQWKSNQRWTHKNAIQPSQKISIKISGNRKTPITDLKISNIIVSDQFKSPIIIEQWDVNKKFEMGDYITFDGRVYICRQGHTSYDPRWTPKATLALWLPKL